MLPCHIFLARAPGALLLVIVGFIVMFTGGLFLAQVEVEEFMEMVGVTLIAWSAWSLLVAYGFELRLPQAAASKRRRDLTVRPAAATCASVRSAGS